MLEKAVLNCELKEPLLEGLLTHEKGAKRILEVRVIPGTPYLISAGSLKDK